MRAPNVTYPAQMAQAPRVSQYPAPYSPAQTEITDMITAIMPIIVIMMMMGMMKPMFASVSR